MAEKIRVMIVDDHKVVRVGLRTMIEREPDMEVVAEAEDRASTLAAHAAAHPDVILLDLRLPDVHGAELIALIRERDPQAKIIMLTSFDASEDIFRAVKAGARS